MIPLVEYLVSGLISAGLVVMSGLFSGLTLGLMSLDIVGLQILAESGSPKDKARAETIIPVRQYGNLLLCTLLIGNTIANAMLSIFMADLTSGILGLFISTTLIVIFGEITPQAVCSRYRLVIGANTILFTKILIVLLFVIAYPISKVLDWMLGKEMGVMYNREGLKTLINMHADPEAQLASGLTVEDSQIMTAVLDYKDRRVKDVMTVIDHVFMLESNTRLNFESMLEIYRSGYTRIPVFNGSRNNIIGILYSKDLILIDPDDEVEVKAVLAFHGMQHARFIPENTALHEVLAKFKLSYTHLMIAFAGSKNQRIVTGMITLEDVIEEVLNDEIVDESDRFMDNTHRQKLSNRSDRPDVTAFLKLFDHKLRKQNELTKEETNAVRAYLKAMVPEFAEFTDNVLEALVQKSEIVEIEFTEAMELIPVDTKALIDLRDNDGARFRKIYTKGVPSDAFSLILQGHLQIEAGSEKFESHIGPWGFLGVNALTHESYVPDFDALATAESRILQIFKEDYKNALKWKDVGQIVGSKLVGRKSMS